jgi:IS30 family transposase
MKYWRHCEDDVKIQGTIYDKRVKYTQEDRENIKKLHLQGLSQRAIAREIGCSRRYVIFTLYPERLEKARENRDWRKYFNRQELTKAVRELRQRKKLLIKQGLIIPIKKI